MPETATAYTLVDSPLGPILVAGDGRDLCAIGFPEDSRAQRPAPDWRRDDAVFAEAARQLRAYFAGELQRFDLPLAFAGTPFQRTVWQALLEIPYGRTVSYGELARRIGRPRASRAVGAANGTNPLPIVAPCHRVVGHDGRLTGFGGGLPAKRFLLAHERRTLGVAEQQPELF